MPQQPFLPGITLPTRPAETRDARDALAAYPDMSTEDLCRYAKILGHSAELVVASILMRLGERDYPALEYERHDRVLFLPGDTPLRIQVKTRHTRTPAGDYVFNFTAEIAERGATGARSVIRRRTSIFLAMVALPEMAVALHRGLADARHTIYASEIPELSPPSTAADAGTRPSIAPRAAPMPIPGRHRRAGHGSGSPRRLTDGSRSPPRRSFPRLRPLAVGRRPPLFSRSSPMTQPSTSFSTPARRPARHPIARLGQPRRQAFRHCLISRAASWAVTRLHGVRACPAKTTPRGGGVLPRCDGHPTSANGDKATVDTGSPRDTKLADTARSSSHSPTLGISTAFSTRSRPKPIGP